MSLTSRTSEIDEHKVEASLEFYGSLLDEIKTRIRQAQVKAALSANAEMIALYWNIGKLIFNRQKQEGSWEDWKLGNREEHQLKNR